MRKKLILTVALSSLLFFLGTTACSQKSKANSEVSQDTTKANKEVNKNNISQNNKGEKTSEPKVTFIELGSKNCIPCKKMEPIMDSIEEKYPEQVEVKFYDIRTPEGRPYARKYDIRVIPTQVFLDSDGKEYFRHKGFFPQKEIEKILKREGV